MFLVRIIVSLLVVGAVDAAASTAPTPSQTVRNAFCPVMTDEPIDLDIHTEFRGEDIYFCCQKCVRKFRADPEKYLANLEQIRLSQAATGPHGHDDVDDHDHATDHGSVEGFPRLIRWIGKFHPLVVHFPIALLIVASLAETLRPFLHVDWLRHTAQFCVLIAAVSAVTAALLGWANAWFGSYPENVQWTLTLHRWFGTTTAAWSVVIAFCSIQAARTQAIKWNRSYLITLFLGALLVGVTGHFGATLVFGTGYYSW